MDLGICKEMKTAWGDVVLDKAMTHFCFIPEEWKLFYAASESIQNWNVGTYAVFDFFSVFACYHQKSLLKIFFLQIT